MLLQFLPILALFLNRVTPTTLNCGEILTSGLTNSKIILAYGMFYGSVITIKGTDMFSGASLVSFRMFDAQSNTILLVNFAKDRTGYNYQTSGGATGPQENYSDPIVPETGNFSVDISINMDRTITITGIVTWTFKMVIGTDVAQTIRFSNLPASSIKYTCNCRAPNADKALITMCLGL